MISTAWESVVRLISWLLSRAFTHYRQIGGALVVLASTYYGLAFARFYSALGTSPDALGVSAAQMLARSAVGGALVMGFWTLFMFALAAPFIPRLAGVAESRQRGGVRLDGGEGFLGVLAIGVGGGLLWFWFLGTADAPLDSRLLFGVAPGLLAVLISLRYRLRWPWIAGVKRLRFRVADFGAVAVLIAVAGVLPIASVTLRVAKEAGEDAKAGVAVEPVKFLGISMLGIRSDPAELLWAGGGEGAKLPDCVSYLGRSGNTLVVYDPTEHQTLQLAAEDAVLTTRDEWTACGAPLNYAKPTIRRRHGVLECLPGRWGGRPHLGFSFSWTEDGYAMETAIDNRFRVYPVDRGAEIQCGVVATNVRGSDAAYSPPFLLSLSP